MTLFTEGPFLWNSNAITTGHSRLTPNQKLKHTCTQAARHTHTHTHTHTSQSFSQSKASHRLRPFVTSNPHSSSAKALTRQTHQSSVSHGNGHRLYAGLILMSIIF